MRKGHPRPLKRRQEQQQHMRCYRFMHPMSDLSPESVTTSIRGGQTESNLRKNIWLGVFVELI